MRLLVHVDDLLITGNYAKILVEAKKQLAGQFELRDLGEALMYLGIEIVRDKATGGVKISQKRYAMDLVQKFGLDDAKPDVIPMQPNLASVGAMGMSEVEEKPFEDATRYQDKRVREKEQHGHVSLSTAQQRT